MSDSQKVYLLYAVQDYEAWILLGIYADKARADKVCLLATEYQKTQPNRFNGEAPTESEMDEWDAWAAKHPGGEMAYFAGKQGYAVVEQDVLH